MRTSDLLNPTSSAGGAPPLRHALRPNIIFCRAVDQARKKEVLPHLKRMVSETRIPILCVSHQRDEIERFAQCVVSLDAGRVVNVDRQAESG